MQDTRSPWMASQFPMTLLAFKAKNALVDGSLTGLIQSCAVLLIAGMGRSRAAYEQGQEAPAAGTCSAQHAGKNKVCSSVHPS